MTGMVAALNRFVSRSSDRCRPFFQLLRKKAGYVWGEDCEEAFQALKKYLATPPLISSPKTEDVLTLYLAVSEHAVSAALIREEDRQQQPVYYISKTLLDAETRYLPLEKLLLALVTSSRKLRHYFLAHRIEVPTVHPLASVLRKADLSGRVAAWSVELG